MLFLRRPVEPQLLVSQCTAPDGTAYAVDVYTRRRRGSYRRCIRVVEKTMDAWLEVPMRLSLFSRLAHATFTQWPPDGVDTFSAGPDGLVLSWRDGWIPYEAPILPFGLDQESRWGATYKPAFMTWSIKRLQRLDYHGDDPPPVYPYPPDYWARMAGRR